MKIKKSKFIGVVLSVVLSFIFTVACSSSGNIRNTFIVGFDAEFPPYGFIDDSGEYIGFDLDLAEEVCKRRGWELIKRPISWDSKDSELNSGAIDCIWNGFTMNGRESQYTWSTPYIDNSQIVIVKTESHINKLNDLSGKRLIVQSDSSALAALEGDDATDENKTLCNSLKDLQQVSDYNSAFMNLESGTVDAIAMDIGVATYQLSSKSGKFRILNERLSTEKYGIGFKPGNSELRDQVQESLFEMLDDGTFESIADKWGLNDNICLSHDDKVIDLEDNDSLNSVKKTDIMNIIRQLLKGLLSTLSIFCCTLLFALPLGLLLSVIRMSHYKVLQWVARIYISIMRGTPLMLQLLVIFFAPYYVFGVSTSYSYRFYAVVIGFSLNYAAYFAEIYRSGIQSIPAGQREAAKVMGYGRFQTFFRIIFPQMVKRVLPAVTNEIITLVKDTSLAFALAYTEMFTMAKQIAASQTSLLPLFISGLFYYVFNFIVAFIMESIEKRLNYYK